MTTVNLQSHGDGIAAGWVHLPGDPFPVRGYLARPEVDGDVPVVLMAHENLGVTPHRQDVTRRVAQAGYACLTVDLFSRIGGMPPQDYRDAGERRAKAFDAARDERAVVDLQAGWAFLRGVDGVDADRAAAIGFCLGGGTVMAWAATPVPLRCVVALYGIPVLPAEYSPTGEPRSRIALLPHLNAPIQLHYGERDDAIPLDQIDALEAELGRCRHKAELHRYPEAGHAYHDDTHPNHDPEAAQLTWQRTLAFLGEHLP